MSARRVMSPSTHAMYGYLVAMCCMTADEKSTSATPRPRVSQHPRGGGRGGGRTDDVGVAGMVHVGTEAAVATPEHEDARVLVRHQLVQHLPQIVILLPRQQRHATAQRSTGHGSNAPS